MLAMHPYWVISGLILCVVLIGLQQFIEKLMQFTCYLLSDIAVMLEKLFANSRSKVFSKLLLFQ